MERSEADRQEGAPYLPLSEDRSDPETGHTFRLVEGPLMAGSEIREIEHHIWGGGGLLDRRMFKDVGRSAPLDRNVAT